MPRIAELRETVTGIKNELVEQTSQAFDQVGQLASSTADPEGFQLDPDKPGQFRSLHEACLVVDALGGQARQHQVITISYDVSVPFLFLTMVIFSHTLLIANVLCTPQQIESFCNRQMEPYSPLFPKGSPQAQLDQVDRRFAWFRRLLRSVDLRFDGVFPKHWRVQQRLCMMFLTQTRAALLEVLEDGSKEAEDVTVLLKVNPQNTAAVNSCHFALRYVNASSFSHFLSDSFQVFRKMEQATE